MSAQRSEPLRPKYAVQLEQEIGRVRAKLRGNNGIAEQSGLDPNRIEAIVRGETPTGKEHRQLVRALPRMKHFQGLLLEYQNMKQPRIVSVPAPESIEQPHVHHAAAPDKTASPVIQSNPKPASALVVSTPIKTQYTRIEKIGPDDAQLYLDGNVINRPIKQNHVAFLANEMKHGRWRLTHQGIAFDTESRLIDGQHRLHAVMMSGCTVEMTVTYNADPSSYLVVDTGDVPRSLSDVWAMADKTGLGPGLDDGGRRKAVIAALRIICRFSHDNVNRWSMSDLMESGALYPETGEAVRITPKFRSAVAAGVAYILPVEDRTIIDDFLNKIRTRLEMQPLHVAYLRAYETLVGSTSAVGHEQTSVVMAVLTMRAIYNQKKGDNKTRIYVKDPNEFQPVQDPVFLHYRGLREKKRLAR